ncbi:acyltransferase [Podospora didyma]|uniref:Acyltransferase n=1 Tax=Podospora didyma TaxID=330526 RepID=A0AAE0K4T3_9PEZI|nr:acyltransferase [Podospora didyma]
MEKFSQFRDKGSGISPFMPTSTPASALFSAVHVFLFLFRLPLFLSYVGLYFLFLHNLPLPVVARKLLLWGVMGIPGIWWVDLQLDGVKRGALSQQPPSRVPHARSVVAANFTSPLDALYLAAVFDPVFTISYPHTRKVRRIGLFRAIGMALAPLACSPSPEDSSSSGGGLTDLNTLLDRYPGRVIAVFPECGTTNGKGILPLSPSLLGVPADVAIFPVSLRYTPPNVTTPVPGLAAGASFLWKLLSRPTHCIRIRIAEGMYNTTRATTNGASVSASAASSSSSSAAGAAAVAAGGDVMLEERRLLDRVAEALARLGRAKRVGLTLQDKKAFVEAWKRGRK